MKLVKKVHQQLSSSHRARALGFLALLLFCLTPSIRWTLEDFFKQKWAERLYADLAVTRRSWIPEEELQSLVQQTGASSWSEAAEFFSTIRWNTDSTRLVQVWAVAENFPLRGQLNDPQEQPIQFRLGSQEAMVDETLVSLYGLSSPFELLDQRFTIRETLGTGALGSFRLGSLAYKVIVPLSAFKSQAVSRFATFTHVLYLRFENPDTIEQAAKMLKDRYRLDTQTQVLTPEDFSESLVRPLKWVLDILSLFSFVSLISWLLLGHVRLRHEFQASIAQQLLLNVLGTARAKLAWLHFSKQFSKELGDLLLVLLLCGGITTLLRRFLSNSWEWYVPSQLWLLGLALFALVGLLVTFLILLPSLHLDLSQALKSMASAILYEKAPKRLHRLLFLLLQGMILLGIAFLLFPSKWLIISVAVTWLLLGIFPLLVLRPVTLAILRGKSIRGLTRLVLTRLYRAWPKTLGQSLTFSFVLFQISLVVLIQGPLNEWIIGNPQSSPQLFAFDVSNHDKDEMLQTIQQMGAEALAPSPLIRGRIINHNGQAWQKPEDVAPQTREEENEFRFRSRALNISIRDQLTPSERVEREIAIPEVYKSHMPLSIEKRFASRLGLQLGDELELDIQGFNIKGFIWQIRKVQWNSLLPNFFVQTHSGYIDEAPKTWILAIRKASGETHDLQNHLAQKFPDVSIIDLKQARKDLARLTEIFQWSLGISSGVQGLFFILVLGYLFYISYSERQNEWFLFRALGTPAPWKKYWMILEFSFFSLANMITALLLAWIFVKSLDRFLFQL
jgi:putative ABC transport system permease protein